MSLLVVDVETYGTDPKDGKLLGVAYCFVDDPERARYCWLQRYDYKTSTWHKSPHYDRDVEQLKELLLSRELVGHNYGYDKSWIDHCFSIQTQWVACTRLMWHLASAPSGPRGYGLKDAQIEILGWAAKGNIELEEQVASRGGGKGDMYLAELDVLSKYAVLDASSTAELYLKLKPFFDEHDYWWMLEDMVKYSWLLQQCTDAGIRVDVDGLQDQIKILSDTKEAYTARFMELLEPQINRLERIWRDDRASKYTINPAKERFLKSWEMQKRFKLSSDKDKRELFYDILKLPITAETDGGKGSTAVDSIRQAMRTDRSGTDYTEILEALELAESSETLLNSFAKPWLDSTKRGRLHPRFNPCGTVSYRLSGFKPYLLNAPFDEKDLMGNLTCDEGWEGVHADFASVEPCVTAHYSQDPSLLKVFGKGLGDVYLDLALILFPSDIELHSGYSPQAPITGAIKERFSKQRKVAKIIQLAVQYTGTEYTVHKNLVAAGVVITLAECRELVAAYWRHFHKVKVMNEALFLRFERNGLLRNVVGRIIRVPQTIAIRKKDGTIWNKPIRYKDLPNRFIQSSAHDLLSLLGLIIARLLEERKVTAKPVILDCHDSTSWQAPKEQVEALEQIFKAALTELNETVKMTVPVKIEMKRFKTLAGLKGEE